MKKAWVYIALFTFLTIFLSASGGLFFILHHCNKHDVTELEFVKKDGGSCCHHNEDCCTSPTTEETACCEEDQTLHGEHQSHHISCCTNNPFFLKISFQFLKTQVEKIKVPVFIHVVDLFIPSIIGHSDSDQSGIMPVLRPPGSPGYSGHPFSFSFLRL